VCAGAPFAQGRNETSDGSDEEKDEEKGEDLIAFLERKGKPHKEK